MNQLELGSRSLTIYVNEIYRYTFNQFLLPASASAFRESLRHLLEALSQEAHSYLKIRKHACIVDNTFCLDAVIDGGSKLNVRCFQTYPEAEAWILAVGR